MLFVAAAALSFRLTRLITRDTISQRLREFADDRLALWISNLLVCYWCIGTYITIAVVLGFWGLDLITGEQAFLWAPPIMVVVGVAGTLLDLLNKYGESS